MSPLVPLPIPNKNAMFSDLWCCSFPSLAPSLYSFPFLPFQYGILYNFIRYIGVGMILRWDFCFFILLVREAEQTHIGGWVKQSRILLNNLQSWMRKMRYKMPNVSLTSMERDMKTSKPLCGRKFRGPHARPQLQWEGWPWQPVGQQGSHAQSPCVATGERLCLVHEGEAKHVWQILSAMLSSYFCTGGNTDLKENKNFV